MPKGPIEVDLTARPGVTSAAVAAQPVGKPGSEIVQHVFGVDWAPALDAAAKATGDLVIAVDSSSSVGDVEFDRAVKTAMALAKRHTPGRKVMVVYGDLRAWACRMVPYAAGDEAEVGVASCLNRRMARGASDLGALIGAAMQAADTSRQIFASPQG